MSTLRSLSFLAILLLSTGFLASQSNVRTAYKGVELDIKFQSDTIDCDAIVYDEELVEQSRSNPCKFTVHFDELGLLNTRLMTLAGVELKHLLYEVKPMPEIRALIGASYGGEVPLEEFLDQKGIDVECIDGGIDESLELSFFKFEHYRGKERLLRRLNKGPHYNTEISNLILRVEEGDKIKFTEIEVKIGEFNPVTISPLLIEIPD